MLGPLPAAGKLPWEASSFLFQFQFSSLRNDLWGLYVPSLIQQDPELLPSAAEAKTLPVLKYNMGEAVYGSV